MRPLLILAALVLWKLWQDQQGSPVLGTRTMEALDYFKKTLLPIAKKVEQETGISARLGIFQSSLESNSGTSALARPDAALAIYVGQKVYRTGPALNLFGFKTGDAWIRAGKTYVMIPTKDYYRKGDLMPNGIRATEDGQALVWPAPFRAYSSWEESYRDWARLMGTKTYVEDGALDALRNDDLVAFGDALSKHYAPNQNYSKRLQDRADAIGEVA